ncbi:DUF4352 domain-containing protein [Kitasatospora sp. NPDC057223]|uniref:DUF4352 domain-containing protein n=1 Tax=Kitasatospora sp. NPDC057223 TaxID=3346055 RepID=UPI00362C8088
MRPSLALRSASALAALGLAAVAGCSSHTVETRPAVTSPATGSPVSGSAAGTTGAASASPSTSQARVGDTVELRGSGQGARMAVTVTRVVDPAAAKDQFSTPGAGNRLAAVQFSLHNVGTAPYSDSPSNGAQVIDTQGQAFNATFTDTAAGPGFPGIVTIAPGDTGLGFLTFQLPAASTVAKVQFTLDSGLADNTGQWLVDASVRSGPAASAPAVSPSAASPSAASGAATVSSTPAAGARATVEAYYAAVNAKDYRTAWALGGRNLNHSYTDFVAGFATTARDDLTVIGATGSTVSVVLDAVQSDGSHKVFTGTYTVRGGVIVSADLH